MEPKHEQDLFITSRVLAETLPWKSKTKLLMEKAETKAEVERAMDWTCSLLGGFAETSGAVATMWTSERCKLGDVRKYRSNQGLSVRSAIQLLFQGRGV